MVPLLTTSLCSHTHSCVYVCVYTVYNQSPIIICILFSQVSTVGKKIFITPHYAQNQATFVSPVTTFNDTSIYFGPGSDRDRLLEVPLIPAGRYTINDSIAIQITAVFNGSMLNERDRDPEVGITDGNNRNMFWIADVNNYPRYPPCTPKYATGSPSKTLANVTVPDQFTFLFRPAERFGACSSAQQGGYVNVGIFNYPLDLSRGINLQICKHNGREDYVFYYFLAEIFQ